MDATTEDDLCVGMQARLEQATLDVSRVVP